MAKINWKKQSKKMFLKKLEDNGLTNIILTQEELWKIAEDHNIIISVCMFCGRYIRHQASCGTGGLSHGECEVCHSFNMQRIKAQGKLYQMKDTKRFTPSMKKQFVELHRKIDIIDEILSFRKSTANQGLSIRPAGN